MRERNVDKLIIKEDMGRKRKRPVAQHVQKALDEKKMKAEQLGEVDDQPQPVGSSKKKVKKSQEQQSQVSKKDEHKEMEEGKKYLKAWKRKEDPGTEWKFSKKIQSWLLRNMYSEEKIASKEFKILCSYLEGLAGVNRNRLLEEARGIIEKNALLIQENDSSVAPAPKDSFEFGFDPNAASVVVTTDVNRQQAKLLHDRALKVAEAVA